MTHEEANLIAIGDKIYEVQDKVNPWTVYRIFKSTRADRQEEYRIWIRRNKSWRKITKNNHTKYETEIGVKL